MGLYLNTTPLDKTTWLEQKAREVDLSTAVQELAFNRNLVPITWVDNVYMVAAGFPENEIQLVTRMTNPEDARTRRIFLLTVETLEKGINDNEVAVSDARKAIALWTNRRMP